VFDNLAKSVLEAFTGSQADKDRVQEQLQPILEERFKPCQNLWPHLWSFIENPDPSDKDIEALGKVVSDFIRVSGALVSLPFLQALLQLQVELQDIKVGEDLARSLKIGMVKKKHLLPSAEKDAKGNEVGRPGLLLLLRDEIGSNARSASSAVKS